MLEPNSVIQITEIRQLELPKLPNFPLAEFLSIGFTHHIRIIESAKTLDERLFYIRYCHDYKIHAEDQPTIIKQQCEREGRVVSFWSWCRRRACRGVRPSVRG